MKRARPSLLALPAIAMLVAGVAVPRAADVAPAQSAPAAAAGPVALVVPARGPAAGAPREVLSATGAAPPVLLRDDPRRDRRCLSLASAFGHSANVVFAKLADRDLDPATLRATAERFLFNVAIPFARPLEVSSAEVPADPFDAANTAAGFGSVKLTPLHAALLAAIVANGGMFVPPVLVEQVDGAPLPEPDASRRVVDEEVAARLGAMMRETVAAGTARRVFRRVASSLRGVQVAGKTGSLADAKPFRDYSWFVGYAPADNPVVAVATVVVNDRLWHARAPTVAKEALEAYFAAHAVGREGVGGGAVRTAAVR